MNRWSVPVVLLIAACTKGAETDAPENTAPEAPTVAIAPEAPTTSDDLVATATAGADADGDEVTLTYAWSVDGAPATDLTGDTVPADRTARGEVWSVTVTGSDGALSAEATAEVTIGNTAPTITLDLDPASVGTEGKLVADVGTDDADGDDVSVSFTWTVNGSEVSEIGGSLDGSEFFERGDTVVVTVSAEDGNGGTATATAEVVVGNTAPTAPEVWVYPEVPGYNSDLTCWVEAISTNADLDEVSYTVTWEVDGAPYTGATDDVFLPGDTVPASATEAGQVWTCNVTPNDGSDDGDVGAASVTIVDWGDDLLFNACGATGQNGPASDMCAKYYLGTALDGRTSTEAGIQTWKAPFSSTFSVYACGAQGASATKEYSGGLGACVSGTITLAEGDALFIAVGQQGLGVASGSNGGGGGGTFVVSATGEPLFVAGGGGGTRADAQRNGCDALGSTYGVTGSGGSETHDCAVHTDGLGEGGLMSSESWGSGGAGFNSDGADDAYYDGIIGTGGSAWANGLTGGGVGDYSCDFNAQGGFGGGGAGNGCYGGGGGGGYSGGDGGWIAGGGGSWNSDAAGWSYDGANTGDGFVMIMLGGAIVK
jgi:hypothetical protein